MADKPLLEPPAHVDLPEHPIMEGLAWLLDVTILVDELVSIIGDDRDVLLAVYGRFVDAIGELNRAKDAVGRAAIPLTTKFQPTPVYGGGMFKVGGGKEKKAFDHDRVLAAAADRMTEAMTLERIVTTDGEVGDARVVVAAIVRKTAELLGGTAPSFDSYRSGVAKELGLKLDDYCEVTTGDLTHRIESRPAFGS